MFLRTVDEKIRSERIGCPVLADGESDGTALAWAPHGSSPPWSLTRKDAPERPESERTAGTKQATTLPWAHRGDKVNLQQDGRRNFPAE